MAQVRPGKGGSGPGIAGGNHEVMEMDGRRMAHGQLDLRFQAPWAEKTPKVAMTIIFLSRDYSLTPIRLCEPAVIPAAKGNMTISRTDPFKGFRG